MCLMTWCHESNYYHHFRTEEPPALFLFVFIVFQAVEVCMPSLSHVVGPHKRDYLRHLRTEKPQHHQWLQ